MSHHTQTYIPKHMRPATNRTPNSPNSPNSPAAPTKSARPASAAALAVAAVASPLPTPRVAAATTPVAALAAPTASSPAPASAPSAALPSSRASSFSIGTTLTLISLRADGLSSLIALADELASPRFSPASRLEALGHITRLPFIRIPLRPLRDAGPTADESLAVFTHQAQTANQRLMAAKCQAAAALMAMAQTPMHAASNGLASPAAGAAASPDADRKAVTIRIKAVVTLCRTPITRFAPQDLGEPMPLCEPAANPSNASTPHPNQASNPSPATQTSHAAQSPSPSLAPAPATQRPVASTAPAASATTAALAQSAVAGPSSPSGRALATSAQHFTAPSAGHSAAA